MHYGKPSFGVLALTFALACSAFAPAVSADAYTRLFAVQKKIAEGGDSSAQLHLGEMYELGLGTPVNTDEAMKWYATSAKNGNPLASQKMRALSVSIEEDKQEAQQAKLEAEQAKVPPNIQSPPVAKAATAPSVAKAAPVETKPSAVVADNKAARERRAAKAKADEARRRALVKEILARQHKAAQQDVFE